MVLIQLSLNITFESNQLMVLIQLCMILIQISMILIQISIILIQISMIFDSN